MKLEDVVYLLDDNIWYEMSQRNALGHLYLNHHYEPMFILLYDRGVKGGYIQ
jgi:hypothetical protein